MNWYQFGDSWYNIQSVNQYMSLIIKVNVMSISPISQIIHITIINAVLIYIPHFQWLNIDIDSIAIQVLKSVKNQDY